MENGKLRMENGEEVLRISPIVPVIVLDSVDDALPLSDALLEGGINIMEITLRTDAGLKSIEIISKNIPDMHVGAGTVVDFEGFKKAVDHGAEFIFSPGISDELIRSSRELNTPLIPGVATASEVMKAQTNALSACKLFPASAVGGIDLLKAFNSPFPKMKFCPTGGVNIDNYKDYLKLENVLCIGGSFIVPKEEIKKKKFKEITKLCKMALA